MLNKLLQTMKGYQMVSPGDRVICAVSGGADSVALLFALYLLKEKLDIRLEAAHFNHNLRGEESKRDEAFVRELCDRYDILLHVGSGNVTASKKGLEAAARTARYDFLKILGGKIATAHTADDNAETVLMHMLRGTGLNGLGGITPKSDNLIRPMLNITRADVLAFLAEYNLSYVDDSSNDTDQFLRNRLRHHVMPFFAKENPSYAQTVSSMAQRLREDEAYLQSIAQAENSCNIGKLRALDPAIRGRVLRTLLCNFGVKEPETEHVLLLESLVFAENPSAKANFPGNIVIGRNYEVLEKQTASEDFCYPIPDSGTTSFADLNLTVTIRKDKQDALSVGFIPKGTVVVRSRRAGDQIRLPGGTKSLKKLYIDKKIPASIRNRIPVIADDEGVICVPDFGMNTERIVKGEGASFLSYNKIF